LGLCLQILANTLQGSLQRGSLHAGRQLESTVELGLPARLYGLWRQPSFRCHCIYLVYPAVGKSQVQIHLGLRIRRQFQPKVFAGHFHGVQRLARQAVLGGINGGPAAGQQ
jgi:hypothetical protein